VRCASGFAVFLLLVGCVRDVSREDIELSIGTTYDQWLYRGSDGGAHRFVVRTVEFGPKGEHVHEREVAVPATELPLRATMPLTDDRARWVEFFSITGPPRAVGEGMNVGRIRRSLDYIPAPYGPAEEAHKQP
jgi:hypothetical protein